MAQSGWGRGGPVTMLPLFRSQTQALVLTRLLLGPGEESLTDLAIAVGSDKNAVKHEVDRLEAAGLVFGRPVAAGQCQRGRAGPVDSARPRPAHLRPDPRGRRGTVGRGRDRGGLHLWLVGGPVGT